ncbi:MAG: hypothetical protein HYR75_07030 [Gemmatimonadetes bacterium]|nr:hypothetical protein [Gemmatimonadota bacterium]MBI3568338.1 hypothetical protein [Gemmatimonadota bacterium]
MSISTRLLRALGGAGLLTLASCLKKDATTGVVTVDALTIVQGNNQAVQGGRDLPLAIVLRATDKSGAGVAGVPITLALGDGGGAVTPASALSDAKGEIAAKWTVGTLQATQTLFATAPGVSAVTLNAVALLPTDIVVAQGNNQSARAGSGLTNSIVIRVLGPNNTPMQGITVAFQITAGGGAISPQSAVTTALGEVVAKWTLGTVPGVNTAAVTASTASPVIISATGTP